MARASRSNKKQPAFDPSELEDLIFSPAVGKGVGSHLITLTPTVVRSDITTVTIPSATQDTSDLTTIVTSQANGPPELAPTMPDVSTVGRSNLPTVQRTPKPQSTEKRLWITEHGDLITAARVKRIRLAQDVINSAEECVYDTLWNAKLIQTDEKQSCRVVQAGYDYLVKRTRLSRKTIQRIVAKLIEKDFIAVEVRADIYQRTSTVYRVYSYKAILDQNSRKGRMYVAKMGPGFAYARPLGDTELATAETDPLDLTTVDRSQVTTMVDADMTTVVNTTTVTMVKNDPTTVVIMSPHLLDTDVLDNTSSSSERIREALGKYGTVDDDVIQRLISACREEAPDCTEDEILHFIEEKGSVVRSKEGRVYNPIGFLVTAVAKCCSQKTLQAYRKQKGREEETGRKQESEQEATLERWRREQEASLSDPNIPEQEKHLIRLCLGLNPDTG